MRNAILASLLGVTVITASASAQTRWKEAGKTSAGNIVSVDTKSLKTKDGIITAAVQVRFVTPVKTPKGEWHLSRHIAMFNCAKKTVAAKSSTYYGDDAATKVVEKNVITLPGFGPAIGGSMTQVALDYVCARK
jgi:hypothetical protein